MKKLLIGCSALVLSLVGCSHSPKDSAMSDVQMSEDGYAVSPALFEALENKVGDKIFFEFNSEELSDEARDTLKKQAAFMKEHSHLNFVIEGHCDKRGTIEYNLALGERRANSVKEFLVENGINPERLTTISFGKERPVVLGNTEEAFRQNRRALTVIK